MYNKKTQQPKLENNIYISDDQIKFQLKKEAGVNEEERFLSPLGLANRGTEKVEEEKRWCWPKRERVGVGAGAKKRGKT